MSKFLNKFKNFTFGPFFLFLGQKSHEKAGSFKRHTVWVCNTVPKFRKNTDPFPKICLGWRQTKFYSTLPTPGKSNEWNYSIELRINIIITKLMLCECLDFLYIFSFSTLNMQDEWMETWIPFYVNILL